MADAIKKVLRKIRHKFKAPEKPEPLWKKKLAEQLAKEHQRQFWERDKKIKREDSFRKALLARAKQVDSIRAEKKRQEEIVKQRLKNLKKARRKLARLRKKEVQNAKI